MLEPCAVHHKIYAENTHDGITLYTTFRPAFATTVDHRLPWARCPIAPTSHSSHPKQILSPGHFPDHCHRGRHKTHPRCIEKHVVPRHLQTFSPKTTHPIPSVLGHSLSLSPVPEPAYGALGIGACGPRRGRARANPWCGLPRSAPPGARSPMSPPGCGPGPAWLHASGNHRTRRERSTFGWKRRKQEDDLEGQEDWEGVKDVVCAHTLAPAPLGISHLFRMKALRFGPHNSPLASIYI